MSRIKGNSFFQMLWQDLLLKSHQEASRGFFTLRFSYRIMWQQSMTPFRTFKANCSCVPWKLTRNIKRGKFSQEWHFNSLLSLWASNFFFLLASVLFVTGNNQRNTKFLSLFFIRDVLSLLKQFYERLVTSESPGVTICTMPLEAVRRLPLVFKANKRICQYVKGDTFKRAQPL